MANEKRLIDRNEIFPNGTFFANTEDPLKSLDELIKRIWSIPTVDAVEVVHGYTVIADKPEKVLLDRKCGICDQLMLATDNYCPMCGAKNEGEKIDGLLFADMEEIIDA